MEFIMKLIHKKIVFEDERGRIMDILEKEKIGHVALLTSKKGSIRGNHYHKKSVQYDFLLKGKIKHFSQMPGEEVKTSIIKPNDLVINYPMEKHALVALEDSELLVLATGIRTGGNYEKDTYKLTKKLISC